jgi:hypothetical protein
LHLHTDIAHMHGNYHVLHHIYLHKTKPKAMGLLLVKGKTEITEYYAIKLKRIMVITKLPNSEQSYKGKVKTHKYINRQNQSTIGKL